MPARGIRATLDILPRDRHAIFGLPSASVIYPIVRIIGLLTASAVGPIVRSLWRTSCRSVCVARTRLLRDLRNLPIERHFSERQYHRTSYGLRCWSDRLFSSEDFLQVGLRCPHAASARPKKSLHRAAFLRTSVSSDFLRLALLVRSSALFEELLVGQQQYPHAAFARPKKSSYRTAFPTY